MMQLPRFTNFVEQSLFNSLFNITARGIRNGVKNLRTMYFTSAELSARMDAYSIYSWSKWHSACKRCLQVQHSYMHVCSCHLPLLLWSYYNHATESPLSLWIYINTLILLVAATDLCPQILIVLEGIVRSWRYQLQQSDGEVMLWYQDKLWKIRSSGAWAVRI